MFKTAERGTDIVRSVTFLHRRLDPSPLRHSVEPLGQARRTDVPTPHSAFVKDWIRKEQRVHGGIFTESAAAELHVFENPRAEKQLEIFQWTIEDVVEGDDWSDLLHYAYLLQVVDGSCA